MPAQKVCIYIFDYPEKNSSAAQEYLYRAVKEYCRMCDLEAVPEEKLVVERTEKGKPYFPDCPQIAFSISHSGAYWACAVAQKPVGLDLQEHVLLKDETREEAAARFQKMAKRFFHPTEAEFVSLDSYENFFTVWTAREAYVKQTGQGIDQYFSEHCVIPREKEFWSSIYRQTGEATWKALGKWFRKIEYKVDYSMSVCMDEKCEFAVVDCCR